MIDRTSMPVLLDTPDRCTGHCCRQFPIFVGYGDLMAAVLDTSNLPGRRTFKDGTYILDMLLPLPTVTADTEYTCRHHDPETGDCTAYESRPRMCSEYPYGAVCPFDGCTMPLSPGRAAG